MVFSVVVTVSHAGRPDTVQVLKSAGVGVTVIVPVTPAAGAEADAGLMLTEPVAPSWVRIKVLLSMPKVAVRDETELLVAAVQERVLPLFVTMSHDGAPETVHPV